MNRSVERLRAAVRGMCPGELVVGTFTHPARGRVRCPATPLVAAHLRGLGYRVRERLDPLLPAGDDADGVLLAASYLDPRGGAVGLAVGVHGGDLAAVVAAQEAVLAWSAVWRSRRLVLAAEECCQAGGHACVHIAAARQNLRRFVQRGDRVVLVGRRAEPATTRLAELYDEAVLVESVDEVAGLRLPPDQVSYLVAPGIEIERAARVLTALRGRYPRLRGPHPDDLCYAASDRLATVHAVAAGCDRVLVLGAPATVDTARLAGAATAGNPVHVVDRIERIRLAWFAGTESVGVLTTPSASPLLLHTVVDVLSGLGPLSVVRRRTSTELVAADSWPRSADIPRGATTHLPAVVR